MDVTVVKLVCLALLAGVFTATVILTPWLFGQTGKTKAGRHAETRGREAPTRP